MKKILILLLIVVLPFLISCELTPEQKMVMALYRLERTSYTMEGTYLYEYTIYQSGHYYQFSENADAYFEVDNDEIYSEVKIKHDTFYTYVKKNRKNILKVNMSLLVFLLSPLSSTYYSIIRTLF